MNWWQALLLGSGAGLIIGAPIIAGIIKLYKNTRMRLSIKKHIRNNQFLIPVDPRDYNTEAWKDKINPDDHKQDLINLNEKIFAKKREEETIKANQENLQNGNTTTREPEPTTV